MKWVPWALWCVSVLPCPWLLPANGLLFPVLPEEPELPLGNGLVLLVLPVKPELLTPAPLEN